MPDQADSKRGGKGGEGSRTCCTEVHEVNRGDMANMDDAMGTRGLSGHTTFPGMYD
jgi:hypothetical protein